ncbi:MAG: HD domain-containing protein [Micavibrio sp.]
MNYIPKNFALDLKAHIGSYRYDAERFRPLEMLVMEKIRAYDPEYGPYLADHLGKTSSYLKGFMIARGYDGPSADKVAAAFKLHDAGKIMQDISLWAFTNEKPDWEKKQKRAAHTKLGRAVLMDAMDETGFIPDGHDALHIETILYLMETHHERIDGSGPLGFHGAQMDEILRMATILDEIDGKIKIAGGRPDDNKPLNAVFQEIGGSKHAGKFDLDLVAACEAYCRRKNLFLPPIKAPQLQPDPLQI